VTGEGSRPIDGTRPLIRLASDDASHLLPQGEKEVAPVLTSYLAPKVVLPNSSFCRALRREQRRGAHGTMVRDARPSLPSPLVGEGGTNARSAFVTGEGSRPIGGTRPFIRLASDDASHLLPQGEKEVAPVLTSYLAPKVVLPNSSFCVEGCERQYCGGAVT
jgi:hypothetical protein